MHAGCNSGGGGAVEKQASLGGCADGGAVAYERQPSLTRRHTLSIPTRPTRLQSALKKARPQKQDWRRSLGGRVARLCAPCAPCTTRLPCSQCSPCSPLSKGQTQQESPGAVFTDVPSAEVQRALRNGGALLNDLVAKQWPHISKWFGRTLKESLEPVLKKHVSGYVALGSSNLGETPLSLQNISTCLQEQDCQAAAGERTNMLVIGELEYIGDGEINVDVGADGCIGRVCLKDLKIAGRLVVELAKLTSVPPWFSGLRVYFPDVPFVDLTVHSEVLKIPMLAMKVKGIVVQQLTETIKAFAVLPHRFALQLLPGIDPFHLQHPIPQGILRVEVVRHVGTPQEQDKEAGEGAAPASAAEGTGGGSQAAPRRPWLSSSIFRSAATSLDSVVTVSVGAEEAERCAPGECRDFFVYDWDRQLVSLSVAGSMEGGATVSVASLVAGQGPEIAPPGALSGAAAQAAQRDSGASPSCAPSDARLSLESELGRAAGCLHLRSLWRPLPSPGEVSGTLVLSPARSTWALGEACRGTWLLLVELFYATGLPAAPDDAHHSAKVSVLRKGVAGALAELDSPSAAAATPAEHGLRMLKRTLGESFPAPAEQAIRGAVSPEAWQQLLRRGGQAPGSSSSDESAALVDAVWEHPFCMLLDSEEDTPLLETVKHTELVVAVSRSEKGLTRAERARWPLRTKPFALAGLLSSDGYCTDGSLPLFDGRGLPSSGRVRVRVQLRPLSLPPDLASSRRWNQIVQGAHVVANGVAVLADRVGTNVRALFHRAPNDEDAGRPSPPDGGKRDEPLYGAASQPGARPRWSLWGGSSPRAGAPAPAAAAPAPAAAPPAAAAAATASEDPGAVHPQVASAGLVSRWYRWARPLAPAAEASAAAAPSPAAAPAPAPAAAPPAAAAAATASEHPGTAHPQAASPGLASRWYRWAFPGPPAEAPGASGSAPAAAEAAAGGPKVVLSEAVRRDLDAADAVSHEASRRSLGGRSFGANSERGGSSGSLGGDMVPAGADSPAGAY